MEDKILDKNSEILLSPSPLKGGVKRALFGDNRDKNAGKKKMNQALAELDNMTKEMMKIDTSNPFENAKNAFEGLDNKFADMENVYDKAENVYEGNMENAFEGQKNAYKGMKNQYEDMENAFEDLTVNT